jgi:hypothetical protein
MSAGAPPTTIAAFDAAIDAMGATLAVAQGLVECGRAVDLAGLDQEMARLCAGILALDAADGRALRPGLEALVHQVDRLHATLAPR